MSRHLLITGDYPPRAGGQARFLRDLWGGLPSSRATVLAPRVAGESDEPDVSGPEIVRVGIPLGSGTPARVWRTALLTFHALRLGRRRRVSAVHAGQIMASGTAALACHRLLGCPYTLVAHGADLLEFARHPLAGRLAAAILRNADRVVANSRFTAAEVVRLGADAARVRVLHPVVDAERFSAESVAAAIRARYGLAGQTVLLTVARLIRRKGHDTVLEALAEVRREFRDVHYLVVGDGPTRGELERKAERLGIADGVTFAGFVPEEELPGCYAAADLFVMVSRELASTGDVEGFGIVYLEASAAGRPVVAGRSGGVEDAVEDGVSGILVDPEDPGALVEALTRLLRDPDLRRRMARAGRERVVTRFSRESGAAAFTEVIDELAGGC
jgi:phosphatidylinositol alpha-1,6-mannosyltransferase